MSQDNGTNLMAKLGTTDPKKLVSDAKAAIVAQPTVQQVVDHPDKAQIITGATAAGTTISKDRPAGVRKEKRAPGYYSRHVGRVKLSEGRVIDWPLEQPLNPDPSDTELVAYLEQLVRRGHAKLVVVSEVVTEPVE